MTRKNMQYATFLTIALASTGGAESAEPIDIGSRRELFVDGYLVDRFVGKAELRLQRPVEREVVFTCDRPWEGNWSGLVTYIQDAEVYRMYYTGGQWGRGRTSICYAESKDGVRWTRPELGLIEFNGSKKNNIVLDASGMIAFVPFKDTNPDCQADEQYKAMVARSTPATGLYGYASPDGIHWRMMHDKPLITQGKFDSQNVAFWDAGRRRYVTYYREMRGPNDEIGLTGPQLGLDPNGPSRDVMTCTSTDFLNWSEPKWIQYPGSPREQIYLNQIRPYFRAPHLFVGFPGRFMAGREIEKGLPLLQHPSYKYASISETLFMSSRDGLHFKRWGEAFIRPGPRRERWIYGATFPTYGLLATKGENADTPDELSLYVADGGGWTQSGKADRFRRYTLRIDGFVSVNAPLSGGEVITRPFTMRGTELSLNLATSAAGSIQVEIQTATGKPIEGFALADCPELFGDEIERVVKWSKDSDVSRLAGQPIRLRFVMKDADLYSFQFRPRPSRKTEEHEE
ncbi:MAG: hypothetical protein QGG09_16630 [Pirellulaceae bacterium]|nr:hypothetical protein [Pirellulaceae bacterium]HJN11077.1 hypothetical protein [Pirellulaceae bacterium]